MSRNNQGWERVLEYSNTSKYQILKPVLRYLNKISIFNKSDLQSGISLKNCRSSNGSPHLMTFGQPYFQIKTGSELIKGSIYSGSLLKQILLIETSQRLCSKTMHRQT